MTGNEFMAYMKSKTRDAHPAMCHGDPRVEMYDGMVRIFDERGESMTIRRPLMRQLLALAFQLELCAAELDRRAYELRHQTAPPATTG